MKIVLIAVLLSVVSPAAVFAGPCQDELKKVDGALKGKELTPDQRSQAKDMRNQAQQLCTAGNEQESLDVLTEVKAMLSVE